MQTFLIFFHPSHSRRTQTCSPRSQFQLSPSLWAKLLPRLSARAPGQNFFYYITAITSTRDAPHSFYVLLSVKKINIQTRIQQSASGKQCAGVLLMGTDQTQTHTSAFSFLSCSDRDKAERRRRRFTPPDCNSLMTHTHTTHALAHTQNPFPFYVYTGAAECGASASGCESQHTKQQAKKSLSGTADFSDVDITFLCVGRRVCDNNDFSESFDMLW